MEFQQPFKQQDYGITAISNVHSNNSSDIPE